MSSPLRALGFKTREVPDQLALIRAGDRDAFSAVFDAHYQALCLYVQGYVKHHAAAEEIVQDVFANLWTHRATFALRDTMQSYLFGAARNRAFNWLRDRQVVERWEARAATDPSAVAPASRARSVEEQVERRELTEGLERAMGALSDRQREVVTLRWAGLSCPEAARLMGISTKTVENMLNRAYKTLREELQRFH